MSTKAKPEAEALSVANVAALTPNPWAEQDERLAREADGVDFEWKHGFVLSLRRISGWNKSWAEASARLSRRPDVKSFLTRTAPKEYVYTERDRAFWQGIEMAQFAEGCVVGWRGVLDRNGKPMTFTPKNILEVFGHFPDLYFAARAFAADEANYDPEPVDLETASGN